MAVHRGVEEMRRWTEVVEPTCYFRDRDV
jgi:hypothetical protein